MRKSPIRIDKVTLHIKYDNPPANISFAVGKRVLGIYVAAHVSYKVPGTNPSMRRNEIFQSGDFQEQRQRQIMFAEYFQEEIRRQITDLAKHLKIFRINAVTEVFNEIRGTIMEMDIKVHCAGNYTLYEREPGTVDNTLNTRGTIHG